MPNKQFTATSFRDDVEFILLEWEGAGWKLDAFGRETDEIPFGDAWEQSLDAILPYLCSFVDENSVWRRDGQEVSFWEVVTTGIAVVADERFQTKLTR